MRTTQRVYSIDRLRGWVIALMTVDHAREFFYKAVLVADPMDLNVVPPEVFFTRWVTHFCAPIFVFLAGMSAYLFSQKPGTSKANLSGFLLKRAAILILLELTVINFAWTFHFPPERIYLQVIWAIGISMIALAGLCWLPRWAMAVLVAALIGSSGSPLLAAVSFPAGSALDVLWTILYDRGLIPVTDALQLRTSYPVLPWVGIMGLGFLAGWLFVPGCSPQTRKKALLLGGGLMLLTFLLLRVTNFYGDASLFTVFPGEPVKTLMSFFNVTKYPPSFQFSLMTLGTACLALVGFEKLEGTCGKVLLTFGRVPMFYYILHLYLLHGAACVTLILSGGTSHAKLSVPHVGIVWLIALLCLIVSYPLAIWFSNKKTANPGSWLRYF